MHNIQDFTIINIRDYLQSDVDIGEADLQQLLSDFSCPYNKDVEYFLHHTAIEFSKQSIARSGL